MSGSPNVCCEFDCYEVPAEPIPLEAIAVAPCFAAARRRRENDGLGTVQGIAWFLREPAASLARYTSDPLFRAEQAGFSRSDQDRIVREWRNASVRSGPIPVSGT